MKKFEELRSEWAGQSPSKIPEDGIRRIMEKIKSIKGDQRGTYIILSVTCIILVGFFFYISAYQYQTVMIGLLLMIVALVVRIVLELISINTINRLDASEDATNFKARLIHYYKNRSKVHYIVTPIIILCYCIGFVMLLPSFKATLSQGFYTYIWVSSIVLLVVLGLLIIKQVKKELFILRQLKN